MTSTLFNLLAVLGPGAISGIAIGAAVVSAVLAILGYRLYSQNKIGVAKREAARIIEEANLEAKDIRKDGLLEAKEQQNKMRSDFEKETKERRAEWQRTENRLAQKEMALEKKEDSIDKKEQSLDRKLEDLEKIGRAHV